MAYFFFSIGCFVKKTRSAFVETIIHLLIYKKRRTTFMQRFFLSRVNQEARSNCEKLGCRRVHASENPRRQSLKEILCGFKKRRDHMGI